VPESGRDYRTIAEPTEFEHEFRRQTCGPSSFAFVRFRCEPATSLSFASQAQWPRQLGAQYSKRVEEAVERAVTDAFETAGMPYTPVCRVVLVSVRWDDVQSSEKAFYLAARQALVPLLSDPAKWHTRHSSEEMMDTQTLIASLEAAPGIIIGLVREVPPQNLKRRPAPNKWSAHEHACHITTGHMAFLARLELMLSEPFPKIKSMEPSPDEEAGSLLNADLDEALSQYVRERALVVKRLKELSPEDWQRTAEHEAFSHYSVHIMFRHMLMHEMLHAYRIDELMLKKDWE